MEREIPFHVGDLAFYSPEPNRERMVVVWNVRQDGWLELYASGTHGRERYEVNCFDTPLAIRKPSTKEGRMIAAIWFSVGPRSEP